MPKKKLLMPTGTWQEISGAITKLNQQEALALLRLEAVNDKRPYMLRRLYHRWRAASNLTDMVTLAQGKLPEYLHDRDN